MQKTGKTKERGKNNKEGPTSKLAKGGAIREKKTRRQRKEEATTRSRGECKIGRRSAQKKKPSRSGGTGRDNKGKRRNGRDTTRR